MSTENKFSLLRKMLRAIELSQQATDEELGYVVNYGINVPLGDDLGGDDEEE
jgi:hypothetical protein